MNARVTISDPAQAAEIVISGAPHYARQPKAHIAAKETVYAVTRWDQGQPQFMTIDGHWSGNFADAYILPKAADFAWCAQRNEAQRQWEGGAAGGRPQISKIKMSIYERPIALPRKPRVPQNDQAPVHYHMQDFVAVARPSHDGVIERGADALVVCARGEIGKGRKNILSKSLWRAASHPQQMNPDAVGPIATGYGEAQISSVWHRSTRPAVATLQRVISIKPCRPV